MIMIISCTIPGLSGARSIPFALRTLFLAGRQFAAQSRPAVIRSIAQIYEAQISLSMSSAPEYNAVETV